MWLNVSSQKPPSCEKQEKVDTNKGSPLMRYKHAVCSSSAGHIYLHGGRYGNEPLDDDLWSFDAHENTWHQLDTSGSRPPSLQEHSMVEFEDSLYLFGGQVSASDSENSFWRLDLQKYEWQLLNQRSSRRGAHLEPTNRRAHSAVVRENSMYIYGGFEDFRGSSGQLWEFNFRTQLWQLIDLNASSSSKPEPRHEHSAVVYGDSMYIYGGLSNLKPLRDLWRWSWKDKRWFREKTKGRSPGYLYGHTAIQAFGSMFIFGGEQKGLTTRALWRLNLSNMLWHKIRSREPQPSPMTWHGAVVNPLNKLDEMNYIVESANQASVGLSGENFNQGVSQSNNSSFVCPTQPLNSISAENLKSFTEPRSNWRKKRGSRITFLRRLRRRTLDSSHQKSNSMIEHFTLSPTSNMEHPSTSSQLPAICPSQSVDSLPTNRKVGSINTMIEEEYEQSEINERPATSILDSLNEDIKQMFENHSIKPENQLSEMQDDRSGKLPAQIQSNDLTISNTEYVTISKSTSAAINPESQRTSCSYVTPMSEMSMVTDPIDPPKVISNLSSDSHVRAWTAIKNRSVRRDNRPKSEIVQSLIERADSSIKHMYTPFFKRTDPKRLSLGDPTKRHTLPQTMTYYNLYFEEELNELSMIPGQHQLSSSTIRPSTSTQHSGIGELVEKSSSIRGISQKADLCSLASLGVASSTGSRTLCAQGISSEASGSTIGNIESIPCALTVRRDTADEGGDNTSLSFSAIAEFEEDDMLQYASPDSDEKPQKTAKLVSEIGSHFMSSRDEADHSEPDAMDSDEMSVVNSVALGNSGKKERGQKRAHKSTSSGYHSSSGYANSTKSIHLEHGQRQEADTGSSLGEITSETSPEQTFASRQLKSLRVNNDRKPPVSSATIDSLAVLSTTESTSKNSTRQVPTESGSSGVELDRSVRTEITTAQTKPMKAFRARFFGEQKAKTRYWQLCMFVIGGKQTGALGLNEPINVWRLYI